MTKSMTRLFILILLPLLVSIATAEEFQTLFNGKDLSGWAGKEGYWTVKDGAILGETSKEKPGGTFLVWQGGEIGDFVFRAKARFKGNNSGVQYRSELTDPENFIVRGYQADLHPKAEFFGMLYGQQLDGRGIVAQRFQRVEVAADGKSKVVAEIGDRNQSLDGEEWNELTIIAVGNRQIHQINGVNTIDLTENHPKARQKGILALQLHGGAPMTVEFKDIQLRHLSGDDAADTIKAAIESTKKAPKSAAKKAAQKKGAFAWVSESPKPDWVWKVDSPTDNAPVYLRQKFTVKDTVKAARLYFTCDNHAKVWINGKSAGTASDWMHPVMKTDIKGLLKSGTNQIAVQGKNAGGIAAFVFKLEVEEANGTKQQVVSSVDWKCSSAEAKDWTLASYDDSTWNLKLKKMGDFGQGPWSTPGISQSGGGRNSSGGDPLDIDGITVADGFKVELLYQVPKGEQGSWVSLTTDDKGRLLASDQGKAGIYRITITEQSDKPKVEVEKMPVNISSGQGLVWHQDALYFNTNGGPFYKVTDTTGDGLLNHAEELPGARGGGEHGTHAVIVAADGENLYFDGGNHADLPNADDISRTRVPTWSEDLLLPREWDANGHARGRLAPGGWVSKFDLETNKHEIISTGYRNQYDIALNRAKDLFTYDADMEWDLGAPWYRPTRLNLVCSGSDYGWRSGSGKWPAYYEDSLPPVVDIGPGCPTGVINGLGAKFPAKYQDAIYALDWTFGTIYAIHLQPDGAGYKGVQESFCHGTPLPVTDAIIGHDGAFYFTIGGRNTQSALFRITYTGDQPTEPASEEIAGGAARQLRRNLEDFHGVENPSAIEAAWPHLSSEDRWLRHAARVAIESQPVEQWADKVHAENNSQSIISSAVALARMGNESHRDAQLETLLKLNPAELSEPQLLGLLRAYALTFIRLGKPTAEQQGKVIAALDAHFPHTSKNVNTEMVRVMVYLEAASVIEKTMALIANRGPAEVPDWTELAGRNKGYGGTVLKLLENHPPSHEINYAFMLRNLRKGWTMDQRRSYIEFINAAAKYPGGNSYGKFLGNLRDEILGYMTNAQRAEVADISGENFNPVPNFKITPPKGPGRNWTLAEASKVIKQKGRAIPGTTFETGRNLFHAIGCAACHRFGGMGGDIGPDLTTVKNKFDAHYLLESIIEPSKAISDQYGSKIITLKDGAIHTGLVVERGDTVEIYPAAKTSEELKPKVMKASEIARIEESPVSQMPPMMLNSLNSDEVRELIAYMLSGGDPKARVYK